MPQMTGLELQQQLGSTGSGIVASAASTITNVNDFSNRRSREGRRNPWL
jgi:hypothetical protein